MTIVRYFKTPALTAIVYVTSVISIWAAQVVTADHAQWANQAIQQEKQLTAITKPNSVAVLYFKSLSDDRSLDPLQKGLAVMLISDLNKLDIITVIERAQLQALVEELGFGQSGLVNPDGAPRIGRLVQSQYIIGGSFSGSAATQVSAGTQLIDVASGKTIGSAKAKATINDIFKLEKALLSQIILDLKLELTPKQKKMIETPLSHKPDALMDLFQGIDAADHRQFDEAKQHLNRAVQLDPGLTLAKTTLQEIERVRLSSPAIKAQPQATKTEKKTKEQTAFEHRRRLLRATRNATSFSTDLKPATPVSRIPSPAAVQPPPLDQRINQDLLDMRTDQ
ncbi:MAG: hypothetical protein HKP58_17375 [Desulfatitalea sp.]|nr:CsgG/HfaB family protein [Desulfatitalea sp.]NNK02185.1 hypothetical protein [Desulfatitalea sp.]